MKKIAALTVLIVSAVCYGAGGKNRPDGHFTAGGGNGELVVFGVSAGQTSRQKEIENARNDAAYKIALYHGLRAKILNVQNSGSGFYDFYADTTVELSPLDTGSIESYKESLRYDGDTGVTRTENTVFVRFTCPAPEFSPVQYESGIENGKPRWTQKREPLEISGYVLSAGFSGRRRRLKDAVAASYENAAAALLAVGTSDIRVMDTDSGYGASTRIVETIEGSLSGFHILEIWIDPKTKAVWTLAAAKKM